MLSRAYGGCLIRNPDHWTTCVLPRGKNRWAHRCCACLAGVSVFLCRSAKLLSSRADAPTDTCACWHRFVALALIASWRVRASHGASTAHLSKPHLPCLMLQRCHAPSTPAARRQPRCSAAAARSRRSGCGASSPPASCSGCRGEVARAASLSTQHTPTPANVAHRTQRLPLLNLASTLLMSQLSGKRSERV